MMRAPRKMALKQEAYERFAIVVICEGTRERDMKKKQEKSG